jgi:branched-chain amino acid transport system ATP-binding protein
LDWPTRSRCWCYGEIIAFDTPDAVRADARVQEAYLGQRGEQVAHGGPA